MDCPECGYEMGPFDVECPRCRALQKQANAPPAKMPGPIGPARPAAGYQTRQAPGTNSRMVAVGAIGTLVVVAVAWFLLFGPPRTLRVYNKAVLAHSNGNLVQAIELYRACIARNPDFPPAYLNLGFALLAGKHLEGISAEQIDALVTKAVYGETQLLDEAAECFRNCIRAGGKLRPDTVLVKDAVGGELNARQVEARGHTALAMVSIIRAIASEAAGNPRQVRQRVGEARQELRSARQKDPQVPGAASLEGLIASSGY